MYKKILVAVDGSVTSLSGLNEAIRLAKATGSRLLLVHVLNTLILETEIASTAYYQALAEEIRSSGLKILEHAAMVARDAGVPFEQQMVEKIGAHAWKEIVAQASDSGAELIVLGTHGRRGLKRLILGSDAELVLRHAPVPVLMVRDQSLE
ncbi:universal stress protein [Peristeroidobacter soli]|uniref:universal stress protein n=1 Tax=Peristeroidobacter soli TaxID=2497877 RepID=UPI00101DD630|nr:universal stress protein [Peristeroidobacter soli]